MSVIGVRVCITGTALVNSHPAQSRALCSSHDALTKVRRSTAV